ncbi:MAG: fumarylacetoacetate hydrolase family protein [Desulfobacterales bacterium]|nr:fumarylacetoacetate hydrolase family protein [Desulfobacterales bacterium]
MKIGQFYYENRVCLGVIEANGIAVIKFDGDMVDFIKRGEPPEISSKTISLEEVKWAAPVSRPSKIIGLGLNYKDHAEESKGKIPEVPLIFAKFPNSLNAHNEPITWDVNLTRKVDFEVELTVIIGKKVHDCPESEAMKAIFGYTCANDVSARDLQFGDGQWVRGKSLDTFCPLGPWIVTADELPDPHSLKVRYWLNGRLMQDSHTSLMIFRIPSVVSFLSHNFTLLPGDVILTGTPSGVGVFRDPSIYMKDGDEVAVEVEGIGRLVNTCRTR